MELGFRPARMMVLAGALLAIPAMSATPGQAQPQMQKSGPSSGAIVKGAPKGIVVAPKSGAPKMQVMKQPTMKKMPPPPTVITKKGPPPIVKPPFVKPPIVKPPVVAHRRVWRPGLRWRWLSVPTLFIAESLEWCHIHRYRAGGMRYHDDVECHRHSNWDHPSIRYVETY